MTSLFVQREAQRFLLFVFNFILHNMAAFSILSSQLYNHMGFSRCMWWCASYLRNWRFHKTKHPNCLQSYSLCYAKYKTDKINSDDMLPVPNPSDGAWHFYVLVYLFHVPPQFSCFRDLQALARKTRGSCDSFSLFTTIITIFRQLAGCLRFLTRDNRMEN